MTKGLNGTINTELLRDYMEQECLSLNGFCKRCGISPGTFRLLEQGNTCRATTAVKICFATGLSLNDVMIVNKKDEN